ncbi:MAG: ferredoxin family protein [Deltaproteobacteria bacterium]|jgi:adenylylsulfate reductase subunit B|nr:ferredoxin family protein [Deltaproteobacteria bacterium]
MSVKIIPDRCRGCGRCLTVCPGDLIALDSSLAAIKEPELCWGCAACLKTCPYEAIALYLSPAQGGRGLKLTIKKDGTTLFWKATAPDYQTVIVTDSAKAKDY